MEVAEADGRGWVLGVDIGGTNLVVAAIPVHGGGAVATHSAPTAPERGPDAAVADIAAMASTVITETLNDHGIAGDTFVGMGIGCPGPLDPASGSVISTPNLGWDDYPIRDRLSEAVGLPASLENDANCATYGEWWREAGRGTRSLVGVTLGTGVGGGIVLDGRLVRGASGGAGELGHTTIDFKGRRCGCGNHGCLEAYVSGPSIAARAREGLVARSDSLLSSLVDGKLERITALTVYEALVQGDDYAREVMTETGTLLGVGVSSIINTFNPAVVVIVGGVTRAGEHLFGPLRAEVGRRAFSGALEACSIVPGALAGTAGVVGAAGIFLGAQQAPR